MHKYRLVREDANGREKPSVVLAHEHGVSSTTVLRILKKNQVKPFKISKIPSTK